MSESVKLLSIFFGVVAIGCWIGGRPRLPLAKSVATLLTALVAGIIAIWLLDFGKVLVSQTSQISFMKNFLFLLFICATGYKIGRDRYLKEELGAVQTGHITLDDLKNQSDDDLKGSWIDWYSDPMFGGLSPDDFEEGSYDKDTVLKILNDKGTMPTKDEIVKYVSDNLGSDEPDSSDNMMTVEEYSPANEEFRLYVNKIYGDGPFTVEELKEYENEFDDYFNYGDEGLEELDEILYGDKQKDDKKPESTNLGDIAKALTANDLGRSL